VARAYPHLGSALKREWKTPDAAIGELRECVDALFDVLSTLHNVMERRKERDRWEGAIREETPARPACVRGEHWEVYQQYIQNRFPQAIRELDIEGFARGNADCFDRLLRLREDKEKEQKARETAGEMLVRPSPVLNIYTMPSSPTFTIDFLFLLVPNCHPCSRGLSWRLKQAIKCWNE
jgi:hypothetical protein